VGKKAGRGGREEGYVGHLREGGTQAIGLRGGTMGRPLWDECQQLVIGPKPANSRVEAGCGADC